MRIKIALASTIAALLTSGITHAQSSSAITPPEVQSRVDAAYPPAALAARRESSVVLRVTVGLDGRVSEVAVVQSGGAEFDAAALVAVEAWRFTPARRGETPVVSRIQIPFRFTLPPVELPAAAKSAPGVEKPPAVEKPAVVETPAVEKPAVVDKPAVVEKAAPARAAENAEEEVVDVTVRGHRLPRSRANSDFVLDHDVLAVTNKQSAGELLASAPGVYVARPEGEAVANEVFLRGFDAEHGQDIAFTVGSIPLNQPSHVHGQGYADLNLVIPEVVRAVRVTEGVYDPRQGDFAVAGSIAFDLAVPAGERGVHLRSTYGSFNTFRQLALWAPKNQAEETFAAVEIRRSDGYGQNRGSLSGGGIGQYSFELPGNIQGLVHVAFHGARAGLAGVLRTDDIAAGRVGYYDSYPDPSANAQSAFSTRTQAEIDLGRAMSDGSRLGISVWFALSDFRLRENFTGYLLRSRTNPAWVGRGDLIEQQNHDLGVGAKAFFRTRKLQPAKWLSGLFELGLTFDTHGIDQTENLLQQPNNETWDKRIDASLRVSDVAVYADADFRFTRYVHLRGGVRADVLFFDVNDRLGNFTPTFQQQNHLVGYSRTAAGIAWGPRLSLEVEPHPWISLVAAYGQGYRSPQARQLDEGESAPFAKVNSVEGGVHFKPNGGQKIDLTATGYATFLSADLAFDPTAGSLQRIGPTTRAGIAAHVVARPWRWAIASLSITWVHATLDEPPPATAQNPSPPFSPGQLLPYVPPVVVRADVGATGELTRFRGGPLVGKIGTGFTFLSSRPLPYGQFGDPVYLWDLSASLRWRWIELAFDAINVLNLKYAATEYSFVSNWQTTPIPSYVPAHHISAGPPATLLGTLAFHL